MPNLILRDQPRPAWRRAVAALFVLPLLAGAQQFTYDEFGFNRGLKNAAVNTILQDRSGFLWVGTMSGLFRGDGYEFREFGEADGLPDGTIQDLIEDASGQLYVATRSGLAVKVKGRFAPVPMSEPVQVYGRTVLAGDPAGRIYFATNRGLWIGEGQTEGVSFRRFEGLLGAVDAVYVDTTGRVWLSAGRRLLRMAANGESVEPAPPGAPLQRWDDLLQTADGALWVRSSEDLIVLPMNASQFRPAGAGLPGSGFFGALFTDRKGRLMVPTDGGLAMREQGRWRMIGTADGLPNETVSIAFQDREGSLWLGLWGSGLIRVLGYGVVDNWTSASGLPNSTVSAVQRDAQGKLWIGTDNGLARMAKEGRGFTKCDRLEQVKVRSLAMTADGALWVGSFPGGISRVDPETGVVKRLGGGGGAPFDRVNAVLVDAQDRLWVASIEGLFRTPPSPGPEPAFSRVDVPGAAPSEAYFRMAAGAGGVVWVSSSGGVLRFAPPPVERLGVSDGLHALALTHVAETPDGSVWVAYRDPVGITRMRFPAQDGKPRVDHYSTNLASRSILLLRTDRAGRLWVGGDDGLDIYDGRTWARFRRSHGLASYSCSVDAFFPDRDGSVWIGTSRGLTHVKDVTTALYPGPRRQRPVLTWVRFGEQKAEAEPAGPFEVPYGDRDFSVGMAALSFRDRESVRFRYRLLGNHDTWVETTEREARYAGLPPGDYTFEVAVVASEGALPGPTTSLKFNILPPFWMTSWFRALLLLALVGLILLAWQWRMRVLVAHRKELSDLVAVRTRELEVEKARVAEERDRANEANRFKSEFIARMSHEVRTPVHGLVGMTDLLLLDDLKPEQREMLRVVQDSAGLLIKLLDDVLDLSRLEAGKLVLEQVEFDLRRVAVTVCELMRPAAEKKGLDLSLDYHAPNRIFVGDPHKVRQILLNLTTNAVKFTERGSVTIRVSGGSESGPMDLEVIDTGTGIPEAKIDELFQPFVQLDASIHPKHGGAGLGLSICHALVTAMKGTITAESAPGAGARFLVRLPLRPASPPESGAAGPETVGARNGAGGPLKVLVAEDNEINQIIVSKMLRALGHSVKIVKDGHAAVAEAESDAYDLILMDYRMPQMDGVRATRAIRQGSRNPNTPIIGLSANVLDADRAACLEAGMNDFLGKPLHIKDLRERIARLNPPAADPAESS